MATRETKTPDSVQDDRVWVSGLQELRNYRDDFGARSFRMRRIVFRNAATVLTVCFCSAWSAGQTLKPRPPAGTENKSESPRNSHKTAAQKTIPAPVIVPTPAPSGTP